MSVFETDNTKLLIAAITSIETEDEARRFLEDILTNKEILSISQRLCVAKMLLGKEKYADVEKATGASSATIVRVNQCIRYGSGGYGEILGKLEDRDV